MDFHPTRLSWASFISRDLFHSCFLLRQMAGYQASLTEASFQPGSADSSPRSTLSIHESKDPGLSIISKKFGQPKNCSGSSDEMR